jgi:flagellar biosynthesis/type III secretory pathway M-ring protein FliF/YscJ
MKKVIIGLVALGAIVGLRPVMKRKARQMAAKCKQVMAAQPEGRREAAGMPECRQPKDAQVEDRDEAVASI